MARPRRVPRFLLVFVSSLLAMTLAASTSATLAADDADVQRAVGKIAKQLKLGVQPDVWQDGTPSFVDAATGAASAGPPQADATHVAYAVVDLSKRMIKAVEKRARAKGTDPIIGNQAMLKPGQRALVLIIPMDEALKGELPGGMQGVLSLQGPRGVPLFINGTRDPRAGSEQIVTFGQWPGQAQLLTATTPLEGSGVADAPAWNTGEALGFGYRDGKHLVLVYPLPAGVTSFGLQMQTTEGGKSIFDALSTPRGADRFPVTPDRSAGDFCLHGLAFPVDDGEGNVVEYQVEFTSASDVPVGPGALSGLEFVDASGVAFPGSLQSFDVIGAQRINAALPPGDYELRRAVSEEGAGSVFPLADGTGLSLGGDAAGSLTGAEPCDMLPAPADGISDAALASLAAALGMEPSGMAKDGLSTPYGTHVQFLSSEPGAHPALAFAVENRVSTADDFARRAAASPCEGTSVDFVSGAIVETCPNNVQRLFFLQLQEGLDGPLDVGRVASIDLYADGFADGQIPEAADLVGALANGLPEAIGQALQPYNDAFPSLATPAAE